MSDAPTADQLTDLRADFGPYAAAFTDAEINRLWARCNGTTNALIQFEATLALMARQALAMASRKVDERTGVTSQSKSQEFTHLKAIFEMYRPSLEKAMGKRSIAIGTIRAGQPVDEQPDEDQPGYGQPNGVQFTWPGKIDRNA
jgi:hypothetical protein